MSDLEIVTRPPPRAALMLKLDTLGDLVVFAPVLQCLRTAWPETRLVVLIRRAYVDLAPLLAPGVEFLVTTLDPFAQGPDADPAEVARLRAAVTALQPEVVAAATSRRNWLEVALGAAAPQARRLALGESADDEFFATQLRVALGLNATQVFGEQIPVPAGVPDWQGNFAMADALLGRPVARVAPTLVLDDTALGAVSDFLLRHGLTPGRYVICAAAGFANVRLKTWAPERFAAALQQVQQERGLPVLLIGHEAERDYLEYVARQIGAAPASDASPPGDEVPRVPAESAAGGSSISRNGSRENEVGGSAPPGDDRPRDQEPAPSILLRNDRPRTESPAAGMLLRGEGTGTDSPAAANLLHGERARSEPAEGVLLSAGTRTMPPAAGILLPGERTQSHLAQIQASESWPGEVDAASGAVLWLGGEGTLPQLAALIAQSALYLGNDTGAMHLAAALDIPVVAIFGGGTWPRFVPAARRGAAVVQPLPCFGCGWDCAFGDAPCLGEITVADALAAVDHALGPQPAFAVRPVEHLSPETRALMGKAAARYRATRAGHLARQHKLEELTALAREKDGEIASLKTVCNEREQTIFVLDGHVRHFQAENGTLKADQAVLEKTLAALPADATKAAKTIADLVVHIRNIESLLKHRETELAEMKSSAGNRAAGLHDLEQAKRYGRLLAERDVAVQSLRDALAAREAVIKQLSAETTGFTAILRKLWIGARALVREKGWRPFHGWLFDRIVHDYWMQIGVLRHYPPRPLKWDDRLPGPRLADFALPQVAVVTPSYGQEKFVERTLRSVLDQAYPKLVYVVQDGGSTDRSPEIIARYAARLHHWQSLKDAGQADAIQRGFAHVTGTLGPDDIMAWLNSDDLLAPGSLRFVAEYFATHPQVDVLYGHRIIIDEDDREVGRWIMPRHHPETLEWIDYVPQETLFWRKRAWDLAGGIDPSFHFALDWDLLARFHQADCRMVRVPYFLGAFRVHAEQKTSHAIHTTGADEMRRIRTRFHGENQDAFDTINRHARHARFWGAITARLHEVGVRW